MKRHGWLVAGLGAVALAPALAVAMGGAAVAPPPAVTVYKSPSCTCCTKWIRYLEQAGYKVTAHDMEVVATVKRQLGVPQPLESCHTAVIGAYVVEGHVPADVIARLLREKPAVLGIAVPGMPAGSPGMEGPPPQPYNVLAFQREGGWSVYERR